MIGSSQPVITDDEFNKFREFFYRKTGIMFEDNKRYFVDKRIFERMKAVNSESFRSYFTRLRFQASGEELQKLINLMTVNESYFFREAYQFDCLVNSMLDEITLRKAKGEMVRIWSIPCSSGEEPYSIAIYLLEKWQKLEHYNVEILASDIDTDILERAKEGIYSPRSVQHLPAALLRKYFLQLPSGDYQICQDLRDSVTFSRVNLMDPGDTRPFRKIDVVFCRNLLIYFDDVSRREAAQVLYDAIIPGGFICLGHSESMSRICNLFRVRKLQDAIVYQKPLRGGA
jgi:chemotaxis protein methyltransferase CheR|uniref:protein-glutamate O-methyltransferase n=1 Tax=Desulfobacca acetoxidans TaxID=60893 RepID=A0A7C3WI02_9BACT